MHVKSFVGVRRPQSEKTARLRRLRAYGLESFGAEDRREILEALDMVVWRGVAGGYVDDRRRSVVLDACSSLRETRKE